MKALTLASTAAAYAILVAGLALVLVLPEVANGIIVAAMILLILVGLALKDTGMSLRRPQTLLPLIGGALMVGASLMTAASWFHVLVAFFFAVLYLTGPITAALMRLDGRITPGLVGIVASIGTLGGLGVALYDTFALGLGRAGYSVNNPIHFADLALTLGFVALAGMFSPKLAVRAACLLAPIAAIATVYLSGSRGPMLAALPMAFVAVALSIFWSKRRTMIVVIGLAILAVAAGVFVALRDVPLNHLGAVGRVLELLQFDKPRDRSTSIRLDLYMSAYNAFLASPIYGYGLIDFVAKVVAFPPLSGRPLSFDHLHNDVADFAIAGGIMGIVAYGLFLAAPVIEAVRAPRGRNRRVAVLLATTICVGYAGMGATNAMLGVMSQTLLFAIVLALVAYFARLPGGHPAATV
jgi:O-antigen ligase